MNFLHRIQQGLNTAKFGVNQLLRIYQVKRKIASLRREMKETRQKVADTAMTLHKDEGLSEPELEELCQLLDKLAADVVQKEAQIASIRVEVPGTSAGHFSLSPGMRECPYCHYQIPSESEYCPGCGKALPKAEAVSSSSENHNARLCPHCKRPVLLPDAEFCTACGKSLAGDVDRVTQE